jgi:hypothetical protein
MIVAPTGRSFSLLFFIVPKARLRQLPKARLGQLPKSRLRHDKELLPLAFFI